MAKKVQSSELDKLFKEYFGPPSKWPFYTLRQFALEHQSSDGVKLVCP